MNQAPSTIPDPLANVVMVTNSTTPTTTTTFITSKRISERIANMQQTPGPSASSTVATDIPRNISTISPNESAEDAAQRRRSSSRSIKRKKFDDELVDSTSYSHAKQKSNDGVGEIVTIPDQEFQSTSVEPVAVPIPMAPKKTKSIPVATTPISNVPITKKKARNKHPLSALKYSERNNYWKPADDLALIINVEQTNDLIKVHKGVKFSCQFSYSDIEARWHALLYDQNVKNLALAATRQLHPDVVSLIKSKALFNDAEESLLRNIESRNAPTLDQLQQLINSNPDVFISSRTPKILLKHWSLLRRYNLLCDQTLQPLPRHESVISFTEIEDIVRSEIIEEMKIPINSQAAATKDVINQEVIGAVRKNMLEIRMLENEIPKFQCMLDSITGIAPSDFDNQTYAVLRGRLVRYLMRSKEITIGRTTQDFTVDVDLSLEGPSTKISRLQAIISLQQTGEFLMYNTGKRPIYIDSKPLLTDTSFQINHNSLIEFSSLKFMFLVNLELISKMRNEVLQVVK
ncbi:hypothetical protein RDWZM_009457 [Blomia tropicalis]|uniref:FHA domain-containing protein n=1 Tax=Blomia tropicalis TaxID=40697 RepID=A0A9Q0M6K6_BLOTA|nr:hypothetical protein RDWZM_009457 [Blomia tropicalis]